MQLISENQFINSLTTFRVYNGCMDVRYVKLINMTRGDINLTIIQLENAQTEYFNLIGNMYKRSKRSLFPLGGLFSFLHGTADQHDLYSLKDYVEQLHENQVSQTKVLNDVLFIANISWELINENKLKSTVLLILHQP